MIPKIEVGDSYIMGNRYYWRTVRDPMMADILNKDTSAIKAVRRVIWRKEDEKDGPKTEAGQ